MKREVIIMLKFGNSGYPPRNELFSKEKARVIAQRLNENEEIFKRLLTQVGYETNRSILDYIVKYLGTRMVHGERLGLGNVRSGKDKIHDQSETHHDLQSQENLEP